MEQPQADRTRTMAIIVFTVFVLWVVVDQLSKFWVLDRLGDHGQIDLGWMIAHLVWNPGAAFSIPMPTPIIQGAVALVALYLVARAIPKTTSTIFAGCYGAILGGALGNLIDRFLYDGKVVDFIDLNFWPLTSFPVFNIADIGISVGVAIVVIGLAIHDFKHREPADQGPRHEIVSEETDRAIGG